MDFRRSGQLDERRRRVLMDEIASPADSDAGSPAASPAKGPIRAYAAAVLSELQPRVTDLLPVRPLWVVVAVLLGLTGIATIEAIHVHVAMLSLGEGQTQLAALDARERGSLATWYSSVLLAIAAISSLAIFSMRAHRVDDYRGRYRVWLWTAAALAWLSLDCATGVREALGLALNLVAGRQLLNGSLESASMVTWIAVYGLVFGTLGLRLAAEIWPSRLSMATLAMAALAYVIAACFELEIAASPGWMIPGTIESLTSMLAHLLLVSAVGLYGRHVYLDATGRLKVHIDADRKRRLKSKAKLKVIKAEKTEEAKPRPAVASSSSATGGSAAFGSSSSSANSAAKPGAAISKNSVAAPEADEDADDDDSSYDHLSKSERRRMKKLARREQRRAA
jgi:hypothetical protein